MGNMASITEGALNLRRVVLLMVTMGVALVLASGVAHAAPANDNFGNAQQITGSSAFRMGTNFEATKESGEPNHAGNNPGGKSVWYKWTPQESGEMTIDTAGSTFDTLLAVYTGGAVHVLTTVTSNDDVSSSVHTSKVTFQATAGTTYRIAVDGYNSGSGAKYGNIDLTMEMTPPAPANDNFGNAQQITGAEAAVSDTNVSATKESGEPNHAANPGGKSVWYKWTPQESGETTIDTFGSDFDTLLAVYTGSAVNGLTEVASNDQSGGYLPDQSQVRFMATAGTTYRIAVDGYTPFNNPLAAGSGNITLNLALNTPPPDTTAPSAPVITSPANGSYDNDGSFTISGTTDSTGFVRIFEDGNFVNGGATYIYDLEDGIGYWSVQIGTEYHEVSEGSHSYTAQATDWAGNESVASEARTVIVDKSAPAAPAITSPVEGSRDNDGSFTISGTAEVGAKVELIEGEVLKGEDTADSEGAWSIELTGVPDGSHAYKAKATDKAGNISAESEARTVIVDATAPSVKRVVPVGNATGIAPGANVSAVFSEDMNATSVKSAFKLYKKGSTTPITATVTYDAATKKAVLDPSANLQRGATYKVVVSKAARDLAGNALDQNPSLTGNQQKVWSFTIKP